MEKTISKSYREVLAMTGEDRLNMAKKATAKLIRYLSECVDNRSAVELCFELIGCYVGADRTIDRKEFEFFKAVFEDLDLRYDDFFRFVRNAHSDEIVLQYDLAIENAPEEVRDAFVSVGLVFCACNGAITKSEKQLLERFLF